VSPRDRDEETGKFSQQYERWEFLGAIDELNTPTTAEIAEHVGCSYNLAYRRLHGLEADGFVSKNNVGGAFLWRRTD
jgi:DNA-binding MarR family transcriptional regulator